MLTELPLPVVRAKQLLLVGNLEMKDYSPAGDGHIVQDRCRNCERRGHAYPILQWDRERRAVLDGLSSSRGCDSPVVDCGVGDRGAFPS